MRLPHPSGPDALAGTAGRSGVARGQSEASDPRVAVREFHQAVAQPDMAQVIFFCSSDFELSTLAEEIHRAFGDVPVIGCTTPRLIGPTGSRDHGISGVSFASSDFTATCGRLDNLKHFERQQGQDLVRELLAELYSRSPKVNSVNTFAFLLIDGLSFREEPVARALQYSLGPVPLLGGSAGDDLRFARTFVYAEGQFRSDAAALVVVSTALPFRLFMTQHFVASERRVVVTDADVGRRLVRELDGRAAADVYAELVGMSRDQLDPRVFASFPMAVVIGGTPYVRSISRAGPDGSLTFFCAIEEGVILRVARGAELVENLERSLDAVGGPLGETELILGCDCILRRLEVAQSHVEDRVEDILRRNRFVGFASYGEQYRGVHVNQTLTAIAIGRSGGAAGHG
jgi:hypothetical protein